jgi:malonyl-ACP O-methyltransferase BioC/dethiobiotin synthase
MSTRKQVLAGRFGLAAAGYDRFAAVQRIAADRLAQRILSAGLPARPRILEVGCGTGLLTERLAARLPEADWTVTDLSAGMLRYCRTRLARILLPSPPPHFLVMDAEAPALRPGFDLVCMGLAMQWFEHRDTALRALALLLNGGGLLAASTLCDGSFAGWRAALASEAATDAAPEYPSLGSLQAAWPEGGAGHWHAETLLDRHPRGIDFLRGLRAIGADLPRRGTVPLDPLAMRRALRWFEAEHGAVADYRIGYGLFRRAAQGGVFVTGTDTGVGKTVVSACLAQAWGARYWKPLQTGLRDESGDTVTVARLAGLPPNRIVAPAYELQAPLSPDDAARLEGVPIDPDAILPPPASAVPLVVEGAGGLLVPIGRNRAGDQEMMVDLIRRLALPVVLVARGTLGTINHTLLSLEALRARGILVAGVVLNGACTVNNREAILRLGRVRIIAELPALETLDQDAITRLASLIPPLSSLRPEPPSHTGGPSG